MTTQVVDKTRYAGAAWLRAQGVQVSEFGALVADMLGYVWAGLYHLDGIEGRDFSQPGRIDVVIYGELSTYDDSKLTTLVLLAHRCAVRISIHPAGPRHLKLRFMNRERGQQWDQHPSLDWQVARFVDSCDLWEAE